MKSLSFLCHQLLERWTTFNFLLFLYYYFVCLVLLIMSTGIMKCLIVFLRLSNLLALFQFLIYFQFLLDIYNIGLLSYHSILYVLLFNRGVCEIMSVFFVHWTAIESLQTVSPPTTPSCSSYSLMWKFVVIHCLDILCCLFFSCRDFLLLRIVFDISLLINLMETWRDLLTCTE